MNKQYKSLFSQLIWIIVFYFFISFFFFLKNDKINVLLYSIKNDKILKCEQQIAGWVISFVGTQLLTSSYY